jgi:protein TonB
MEHRAVFGAEREPGLLRRAGLALTAAVAFHAVLAGVVVASSGGATARASRPDGGERSLRVALIRPVATETEVVPTAPPSAPTQAPAPKSPAQTDPGPSAPRNTTSAPAPEVPPETPAETPAGSETAPTSPTDKASQRAGSAARAQGEEPTGRFSATVETDRRVPIPTREILRYTAPQYPEASRRRGETGSVEIVVTVDRRGRVTDHRVMVSSGVTALDQAAIRAIRLWRFPRGNADRLSRHRIDFVLEESP